MLQLGGACYHFSILRAGAMQRVFIGHARVMQNLEEIPLEVKEAFPQPLRKHRLTLGIKSQP
jgi:hypothetical protein